MLKTTPRYTPTIGDEVVGLVMLTFLSLVLGAGGVAVLASIDAPTAVEVVGDLAAAGFGLGLVLTWRRFLRTVRKPRVAAARARHHHT